MAQIPSTPPLPLPPPSSRTDWTRLVPPPVLNGHYLSLPLYETGTPPAPRRARGRPRRAQGRRAEMGEAGEGTQAGAAPRPRGPRRRRSARAGTARAARATCVRPRGLFATRGTGDELPLSGLVDYSPHAGQAQTPRFRGVREMGHGISGAPEQPAVPHGARNVGAVCAAVQEVVEAAVRQDHLPQWFSSNTPFTPGRTTHLEELRGTIFFRLGKLRGTIG